MKLSRVPTYLGVAVLSLAGWAAVLGWVNANAANHVLPDTPFKFETITENERMRISIDKQTMFARLDEDEDLQVGAVVQVVTKSDSGSKTLIDAVVAICGYNGLLVIKGRSYNSEGVLEGETTNPVPFQNVGPGTPAGVIYRHLCTNAPKPTKSDPRYKAPDRYNKFWT